ncbi:ABC transporter permease [Mariniluteicoccus endophyticus]
MSPHPGATSYAAPPYSSLAVAPTGRTRKVRSRGWLPVAGVAAALTVWWLVTRVLFVARPLVAQFAPDRALDGLVELWRTGLLVDSAATSVFRLLAGLVVAAVVGIGAGVLLGQVSWLDAATRPVQLFLRMVSPLSWAPVAIIAVGVRDAPVVALVAAAAVWPVLVATADAVRAVDPAHRQTARLLGATRAEVLRDVVVPSIRPAVLAGVRQAIGLAWVVLVPAEMLGVTSGLGYQILNAKDQLAYHHVTALILVIGTLGFTIDACARWALATRRERREVGR